jgi:hypothetical protein
MSTINNMVEANKSAIETTAKIKLGKAALKAVADAVADKLPAPFNNYANHPAGFLLFANLLTFASTKYDNEKLAEIADAAMLVSYTEVLNKVDIDGFLDSIMDKVK